jgi:putative FmdB family regulatory protein
MPFYEYECANCKYYKEVMQKVSDAPLKKCPSCGKNALKKLVSAPVFRLKGAGWYETDFKSDKEAKRNLAEKEPEPEKKKEAAADSKDAKTEAKPAEKAAEGNAADAKSAEAKPAASKPAAASSAASDTGSRRSTRMIRRSTAKATPKASAKAKKATSRKRR